MRTGKHSLNDKPRQRDLTGDICNIDQLSSAKVKFLH